MASKDPLKSPRYLFKFDLTIYPLGLTQKPQSMVLAVGPGRWPASHSLAASQEPITSLPGRSPHPSKLAPSSRGSPGQSRPCSAGLQRDQRGQGRGLRGSSRSACSLPDIQAPVSHKKPQGRGSYRDGQWITDIDPTNPFAFTSVKPGCPLESGKEVILCSYGLPSSLCRHPVSFLGSDPSSYPRQELGGFF